MSKAQEYAATMREVTSPPAPAFRAPMKRVGYNPPVFMVTTSGDLAVCTEDNTEALHVDDVAGLIAWLKETFED